MPGKFLTLEGGEGAGKTTQARLLADALARRGLRVHQTREPGGAPGAEFLRRVLLSGEIDWSVDAEVLLHFAARAEHLARAIVPALASGAWVVCDRFADSTMAYQGYGQGADRGKIAALTALLPVHPDRTIVLDVSEATASARLRARDAPSDRYDRLGPDFHARVAAGFRRIAADHPGRCVLVEADGPVDRVHRAVLAALEAPAVTSG